MWHSTLMLNARVCHNAMRRSPFLFLLFPQHHLLLSSVMHLAFSDGLVPISSDVSFSQPHTLACARAHTRHKSSTHMPWIFTKILSPTNITNSGSKVSSKCMKFSLYFICIWILYREHCMRRITWRGVGHWLKLKRGWILHKRQRDRVQLNVAIPLL